MSLGLPEKYREWRAAQWEAVVRGSGANSKAKFVAQCAPTGFGKSLAYVANGLLEAANGGRTVILTSTKGLQDQLAKDFAEVSVDVRGQNAYPCVISSVGASVADGPCHIGMQCGKKDSGCAYFDAVRAAVASPVVVTNYAYWLAINRYGEGIGPVTQLICDEAHDAPGILADFLSVELTRDDLRRFATYGRLEETCEIEYWRMQAVRVFEDVEREMRGLRGTGYESASTSRRYKDLKAFRSKLEMMTGMSSDSGNGPGSEWMCEWQDRQVGFGMKARRERTPKFDCVDPRRHAGLLWREARRVLLYSATVRPKTLSMLGISGDEDEGNEYEFNEYESTFPVHRHPIVWVPTIRMSHRSTEGDIRLWLSRIDSIIRTRQDRRGIIHTVSYRRAKYLLENSEYRHLMVGHTKDEARQVIDRFKSGVDRNARILVSPTVTTGYDFPGVECEFQIIGKLPFPDASGGVEKVRGQLDRDRGAYQAIQTLVQMTGRGMRSEDDQCEDFVIDDNISWILAKYKSYFPEWWLRSFKKSNTVPAPLEKLCQ